MAQAAEIISEIEALAVHCRLPILSAEQKMAWMRDWCSDLADFDGDNIRAAFRDWRHSGAVKFPTPGQILPAIRAKIGKTDAVREDGWRELTDAEYDALELPAKERHHLIMANHCEVRAGPMWRNKKPLRPDQMSPEWHALRARAANHRAEAKRLRGFYRPQGTSAPAMQFLERSALAQEAAEDQAPQVDLPSTAGKPDAGGLTPEMRELLGRQRGEG
jgi:hypothetical protein